MKKMNIRFIAQSALLAGLYVALTWLLAPISYGAIQFRISEVLILFVILNPKYAYALIIGCFIANTTSSLGVYDMLFGTVATTIAILPMMKIKRLELACIFPVISNAFVIAIELGIAFDMFMASAFWFNVLTIALGEAVVLYFIGIPMISTIIKNKGLVEVMELQIEDIKTPISLTRSQCVSVIMGSLFIIFYLAYPISENTAFDLTYHHLWLLGYVVLGALSIVLGIIFKNKINYIINLIIVIFALVMFIVTVIVIDDVVGYFYGYLGFIFIMFVINLYGLKSINKRDE